MHAFYQTVLIGCIIGFVCTSLMDSSNSKTKWHRKTKMGVNVPQVWSSRCWYFYVIFFFECVGIVWYRL